MHSVPEECEENDMTEFVERLKDKWKLEVSLSLNRHIWAEDGKERMSMVDSTLYSKLHHKTECFKLACVKKYNQVNDRSISSIFMF